MRSARSYASAQAATLAQIAYMVSDQLPSKPRVISTARAVQASRLGNVSERDDLSATARKQAPVSSQGFVGVGLRLPGPCLRGHYDVRSKTWRPVAGYH